MTDHNNPPAPVAGETGADAGPVANVFLKDNGQYGIMWLRPVSFVDGKAALFSGSAIPQPAAVPDGCSYYEITYKTGERRVVDRAPDSFELRECSIKPLGYANKFGFANLPPMSERTKKEVIGWLTDAAHEAAEEDHAAGIFADHDVAEALSSLAAMLSAAPMPPSQVPEHYEQQPNGSVLPVDPADMGLVVSPVPPSQEAKDAERLDWLIRNEAQVFEINRRYSIREVTESNSITSEFMTARDAIDAAMAATQEAPQ